MILTEEHHTSATLSTTNPTETNLVLKPVLRYEKPATNCPKDETVRTWGTLVKHTLLIQAHLSNYKHFITNSLYNGVFTPSIFAVSIRVSRYRINESVPDISVMACVFQLLSLYRAAEKSLARPTSQCILFDGENISFDASLVVCINSTNIPPIRIINRIYETHNLLSL